MSCCSGRNAGFSLLEVLVVLGILSLTIAVFATSNRGPSPSLELKAHVSALQAEVAAARATAIIEGTTNTHAMAAPLCPGSDATLTFFPDGTAQPADICLTVEPLDQRLRLDPLTAQLVLPDTR